MTAQIAQIPFALTEVLQPSEIGELIDVSSAEGRQPGETIVLAIRELLAQRRTLPPSPAAPAVQALPAPAESSPEAQHAAMAA